MEIGEKNYILRSAVVRAATPHGGATADSDDGEQRSFVLVNEPIGPACKL